ncbi:MAG: methionyl-tRNA formyltransferase [Acutalibacteraceae bacterium]|nr:methionyl-tRNA formyltransferase [Acutalibacteraceae bacterium]
MNIVFMGTPDFAAVSLERLISDGRFNISAVYTQPDKPAGRKKILTPPDVKVLAQKHGLNVHQPNTLKTEDVINELRALKPDVIAVIAYGKILPKAVLDIPKYGCINIHGSLLPKYRGAAPIQRAVIDGEKVTGVTSMLLDEGVDTGDMLFKEETQIMPNETAGELFERLALMGADLLIKTLEALQTGEIERTPQEHSNASYAAMLSKDEIIIDWNMPAQAVHDKVRGMNPWPVAAALYGGKKIKIYKTLLVDKKGKPGEVLSVKPAVVACGSGAVQLIEVQPESKNKMSGEDFFRGQRMTVGDILK